MKNVMSVGMVVALVSCIGFTESPNHHYNLFVSEDFSPSQQSMIVAGATEWQQKLGNFITFSGTSYDGNDGSGDETISVYAAPNGTQLDQDCGGDSNVIGCEYNLGVPSKIFIDTSLSDGLFALTALHELGHSIGCQHITINNVMYWSSSGAATSVQCGDVKEVAKEWNYAFDPNALPVCQGQ